MGDVSGVPSCYECGHACEKATTERGDLVGWICYRCETIALDWRGYGDLSLMGPEYQLEQIRADLEDDVDRDVATGDGEVLEDRVVATFRERSPGVTEQELLEDRRVELDPGETAATCAICGAAGIVPRSAVPREAIVCESCDDELEDDARTYLRRRRDGRR